MEIDTTTYSPDPWMNAMLSGNWEQAWQISDAVLKERAGIPCWHLPRHQQYIWDGSSLAGKRVLVRCYHGLGDTIQFIRFAPALKKIAKKVIVWAQPPLLPLLETVDGIAALLPLHDGTPEVEYDVDVEVMELAHVFRVTVDTIPNKIPYLHVNADHSRSDRRFAVGLVWKAGNWDARRNIPFAALAPLFAWEQVDFVVLQEDPEAAGWIDGMGTWPGQMPLHTYASVVKGLDLLISIDSMPVHLSGAMGVPVWALLHADADWRWMRNRNDSPWYPTVRLFRQERAGDWSSVIADVTAALTQLVNETAVPVQSSAVNCSAPKSITSKP